MPGPTLPTTAPAPAATSTATSAAPAPAVDAQTAATDTGGEQAAPALSWRERLFKRNNKKSAADYYPGADKLRAQAQPAPAPVVETQATAPPAAPQVAPATSDELTQLRAEVALLHARSAAPAVETPPPAPAKIDPRVQPYHAAAAEFLGEGATPVLLQRAVGAMSNLVAWKSHENSPDAALKARAAAEVSRWDEQLDALRLMAGQQHELATMRQRLDRFEAPRVDTAAQTAKLFAPETAPTMAKHFPRLAHVLSQDHGAALKGVIEERLSRLDAALPVAEWQEAAAGILADIDDLFPDPPAAAPATVVTQAAPANLGATAPRQTSGETSPRDPATLTDAERRARLTDRWRSLGPIDSIKPRQGAAN